MTSDASDKSGPTLAGRVIVPPHVMARAVGEELVILNLESGTYFGLDTVGARIWQLIGEGKLLSEVCEVAVSEYEVTRAVFEHDLQALLASLETQGLIKRA